MSTRFGLLTIEKSVENPHFIFCSSFQNLRLGGVKSTFYVPQTRILERYTSAGYHHLVTHVSQLCEFDRHITMWYGWHARSLTRQNPYSKVSSCAPQTTIVEGRTHISACVSRGSPFQGCEYRIWATKTLKRASPGNACWNVGSAFHNRRLGGLITIRPRRANVRQTFTKGMFSCWLWILGSACCANYG